MGRTRGLRTCAVRKPPRRRKGPVGGGREKARPRRIVTENVAPCGGREGTGSFVDSIP
jgi:hypothetical protein